MNNSHMSPQWVVENFLPDCDSRFYSRYPRGECDDMELEQWEEFCADNFPEALSELLKAQREVCAKIYNERTGDRDLWVLAAIDNALIPEPKNRK